MVPFLGFNLAETTLARPPRGGAQAQQKPNSVKAPVVEAELKKTQHSGSDKKPSVLETGTAKTNLAKLTWLSLRFQKTCSWGRKSSPYSWKDIWLTKS